MEGECWYGQQIPKYFSNLNIFPHLNTCLHKLRILDPSKINHKLPEDRSWNTSGFFFFAKSNIISGCFCTALSINVCEVVLTNAINIIWRTLLIINVGSLQWSHRRYWDNMTSILENGYLTKKEHKNFLKWLIPCKKR